MTTQVKTISSNNLFIPGENKNLKVTYENREFYVIDAKGLKSFVQRAYLDKELRGISEDTLQINSSGLILNKAFGKLMKLSKNLLSYLIFVDSLFLQLS